jgi:hypothetical protein
MHLYLFVTDRNGDIDNLRVKSNNYKYALCTQDAFLAERQEWSASSNSQSRRTFSTELDSNSDTSRIHNDWQNG